MAEAQIVSCPGCGKRYSVPPGVAPGQFQCQDCSAVVVYGRAAEPAAPGKPHGAKARSHAKAAAAKRRMARDRSRLAADDEGDDDRRGRGGADPRDPKSPVPYILGFVAVGVLAAVVAFAASRSGGKPPAAPPAAPGKPKEAAGSMEPLGAVPGEAPAGGERKPAAAPEPAPAPAPEPPKPAGGLKTALRGGIEDKKDTFKVAENPPTGGNYGRPQAGLLTMLKEDRFSVVMDLGHLPDTPPDLAQKIDADIVKMADPNAGSEFFRARDRLTKIGRPAIPRVLGIAARLDFSKFSKITDAAEMCQVADAIDETMRGITGFEKFTQLQYNPNSKLEDYPHTIDQWFVWWYTIGYRRETFYREAGAGDDDKL
jgi:hypothetical protein